MPLTASLLNIQESLGISQETVQFVNQVEAEDQGKSQSIKEYMASQNLTARGGLVELYIQDKPKPEESAAAKPSQEGAQADKKDDSKPSEAEEPAKSKEPAEKKDEAKAE